MMESRCPTTYDIAQATGLSQSTVSYALRNEGHLSLKTRKRVLEMAKRLGYRPNLFAANLQSMRNGGAAKGVPVALLMWETPNGKLYPTDPTTNGLRLSAKKMGFDLREYRFREIKTLLRLLGSLYHQGVQGIFICSLPNLGSIRSDAWAPFSVVICGRGTASLPFHNVRVDVFGALVLLWKQVVKQGYQRIGVMLCRHPDRILDDIEREAALHVMQKDMPAGSVALPPYLGNHIDHGKILAWFNRVKPDAVIGFTDEHYYLLRDRLYSRGRWIRGYANLEGTNLKDEAAMSVANTQVGWTAMRLMDSLLRHHDKGIPEQIETLLVEATFKPGKSLPPKKVGKTD